MRVIRKGRLAIISPEHGDQLRLMCERVESGRRLPCDEQAARFPQLPDKPPTPMANLLTGTKLGKLSKTAANAVRLPDIDDLGIRHPIGLEIV